MGGILENVKIEIPAKEVYEDVAQPLVKSTGEIAGLLPRTIHAAFVPLEKWILQREYAIKETEKALEAKLAKYAPEEICEPDMAIAVPVIEAVSRNPDSEIIREMYVNLLTKSMLIHEKQDVHPAFVEIIKQLCPDEAKIIQQMFKDGAPVPAMMAQYAAFTKEKFTRPSIQSSLQVDLKSDEGYEYTYNQLLNSENYFSYVAIFDRCGNMTVQNKNLFKILVTKNEKVAETFSLLANKAYCEYPDNFKTYFENLVRLNVIQDKPTSNYEKEGNYLEIVKSDHMIEILKHIWRDGVHLGEIMGYQLLPHEISFTNFGKEFAKICVGE